MHAPQSLRILSAGISLAALVAFLSVGARAAQSVHPADPPVSELRSLADHYRSRHVGLSAGSALASDADVVLLPALRRS